MVPPPTAVNVERGPHHIHAHEQHGDGPAIVLMHGFPDNRHLYDRLVPQLPGRHVVAFDFLGWGESDKPAEHKYTFENLAGDLDTVVNALGLDRVVLVPHDASGPPAFNWALDHPDQVAGIVALNTFRCRLRPQRPLSDGRLRCRPRRAVPSRSSDTDRWCRPLPPARRTRRCRPGHPQRCHRTRQRIVTAKRTYT